MNTPAQLVWYASYGSNLMRNRFDCYIGGGTPDGSRQEYKGCRDKTPPRGDRPTELPYELYFADHSISWGGAVAFIRPKTGASAYGRMYLVTYDQFNDIVRQENGREVPGPFILPSYDQLKQQDSWTLDGIRLYGRLLKIGVEQGVPILTFTATQDDFEVGAPTEGYVRYIVVGLEETYPCMRKSDIYDYLIKCDGIRGSILPELLSKWVLG